MELLQLRYFQTIARLEHMTNAAKELHVSQPALSKTLHTLETELGVLLFDRKGRVLKLNEYGRAFLAHVDIALENLSAGKQTLADMTSQTYGTIRLAILAASTTIPALLTAFRAEHPFINFDLVQHYQNNLAPHDFDLCITSLPYVSNNMVQIPLLSEEIFLGVPSTHPFATRKSIQLYEASRENFISLKKGTVLRQLSDSFCNAAGFDPIIIFESDDPATVRGLIQANLGLAFIPEISWGRQTSPAVTMLHIDAPICRRVLGIVYKKGSYLSKSAQLFVEFTFNYFGKLDDII